MNGGYNGPSYLIWTVLIIVHQGCTDSLWIVWINMPPKRSSLTFLRVELFFVLHAVNSEHNEWKLILYMITCNSGKSHKSYWTKSIITSVCSYCQFNLPTLWKQREFENAIMNVCVCLRNLLVTHQIPFNSNQSPLIIYLFTAKETTYIFVETTLMISVLNKVFCFVFRRLLIHQRKVL